MSRSAADGVVASFEGGGSFEDAFANIPVGEDGFFAGSDEGSEDVAARHEPAGDKVEREHTPEAPEAPEADEESAETGPKEEGEAPTETEGDEAAPDDGADDAGDSADGGAVELSALAEALDMDESAFAENVQVKLKVNGEETTLPLSEVLSGYQKAAGADQKFEEASRIRKEADGYLAEERGKYQKQYETILTQADALYRVGQELFGIDENSQYMQELRKRDPEEYLSTLEDIRQRADWFKQQANTTFQQLQQQLEQQRQQAFAEAGKRLKERIPDWGDEHRAATRGVLESFGLAPEELDMVTDDRIIAGAYELHRLRKENEELKAQATKKVSAAPKTKGQLAQKLATMKSAPKQKSAKQKTAANLKKLKSTSRMMSLEDVFKEIF